MLQKARIILKEHYGYSWFKKGQEQIIESILQGKDTLGIMPTGGGSPPVTRSRHCCFTG